MKYFYIIKKEIAYMECIYGLYIYNVDSALVSDSNTYFEFRIVFKCSNYIQMFEFIFEC